MSKSQLKKVLSAMTAEQITDLVLDLYSARAEAKEYLDFFVNPDIERKLEKARCAINKEMSRSSRGRNKARPSRIKRYIKDIRSLDPGDEAVCEIMVYAVETACRVGSASQIKESTQTSIAKLLYDTVVKADAAGMLGVYLPRMEKAVEAMASPLFRCNQFRQLMLDTLGDALAAASSQLP